MNTRVELQSLSAEYDLKKFACRKTVADQIAAGLENDPNFINGYESVVIKELQAYLPEPILLDLHRRSPELFDLGTAALCNHYDLASEIIRVNNWAAVPSTILATCSHRMKVLLRKNVGTGFLSDHSPEEVRRANSSPRSDEIVTSPDMNAIDLISTMLDYIANQEVDYGLQLRKRFVKTPSTCSSDS